MTEKKMKARPLAAGFQHDMCKYTKLGKLDKVKWLLDKDANTGTVGSAATKVGRAAMLSAIAFNQKEILLFLLDRGAEANSIADGKSGLHWAIAHRRQDLANILLDKGADPSFEDSLRYQNGLFWASRLGLPCIAERIARSGDVKLDARDKDGRTALIEASIAGEMSTVKVLLSLEASIDLRDYRLGWTALAWSIRYKQKAVARRLLQNHASVFETANGYTDLLKLSLEAGEKDIIRLLLDHLLGLADSGCAEIHTYDLALVELHMSKQLPNEQDSGLTDAALKTLREHNAQGAFSSVLDNFKYALNRPGNMEA